MEDIYDMYNIMRNKIYYGIFHFILDFIITLVNIRETLFV